MILDIHTINTNYKGYLIRHPSLSFSYIKEMRKDAIVHRGDGRGYGVGLGYYDGNSYTRSGDRSAPYRGGSWPSRNYQLNPSHYSNQYHIHLTYESGDFFHATDHW
jgi:hypothetical protein